MGYTHKMSIEEFEKMMIKDGFKKKEFDPNSTTAYRSWYYRNKGKIEVSNLWHIEKSNVVWYKVI